MPEENKLNTSTGTQWVVSILLSIIAFFLVSAYFKLDTVATNVQQLMIRDGGNQEWKKAIIEWKVSVDNKLADMDKARNGRKGNTIN